MRAQVLKDWTQSYDPALKVARGERLFAVKEDVTNWAGWVWCTDASDLSGWLPVQVFETLKIGEVNIATKDFDTTELTVSVSELLFVTNRLNGWSWCRNDQGKEGWVPDNSLEITA